MNAEHGFVRLHVLIGSVMLFASIGDELCGGRAYMGAAIDCVVFTLIEISRKSRPARKDGE